jgi:hypothetical protein
VAVGNFVWDDVNRDGRQDAGEPGVPNIVVQLWNTTKTQVLDSATTNASGSYTLVAPSDGSSYRIRVVRPNSTISFSPKDGASGDNLKDSDVNPSGEHLGFTDIFFIAPNVISITSFDIGLVSNMTIGHNIGDRVFRATSDGRQSTGGFNATVQLLDSSGTLLQTTETITRGAISGYYSFSAAPGSYRLRFIPDTPGIVPSPFPFADVDGVDDSNINAAGLTPLFTLAAGQIRDDLDAGYVNSINVGNFIWDDENRDGSQDPNEPGVPNVTVQLWNGAKNDLIGSATTNAEGRYTLIAPGPGDYRIRVLLPNTSVSFSPKNLAAGDDLDDSDVNPSGTQFGFTDIYSFAPNLISTTSIDVGLISDLPIGHTLGGHAFRADETGTQTPNGFNGFTVELLSPDGSVLQSTQTISRAGRAGFYSFAAAPGNYRLRFTPTSGRVPTPFRDAGGDDENDSDINSSGVTNLFNLATNQIRTDIDAGFVFLCTLGNLIWNDLNENGRQDPGEPGIPDVHVELWDPLKSIRWDETVTSANGTFSLEGYAPGNYRIYVIRPHPTDSFSPVDVGDDELRDSDISSSLLNFGFTAPIDVAANVVSTVRYDCGIILGSGARTIRPTRITHLNLGTPNLLFSGTTGGTYILEHSPDMTAWSPIGASVTTTFSTGSFPLPASTVDDPRHFWRVRRTK